MATKDHRVSRYLGSSHHQDNVVAACYWCNTNKGHKSEAAFKASFKLQLRIFHVSKMRGAHEKRLDTEIEAAQCP